MNPPADPSTSGSASGASLHGGQPPAEATAPTPAQPTAQPRNRLAHEKSPYLKQHEMNPVDWYPWGDEAFERARREQKPVFLSIGYSTCHWCHVMARESFMNEEIAKLLNADFICIKLDREERPDIDQIYMTACQLMTHGGGWPLSAWLTPEGEPFFVGTYFPPEDRHGRAGFKTLLGRIAEAWQSERDEVISSARNMTQALAGVTAVPAGELDPQLLAQAVDEFEAQFDARHGGFEGRNKFPRSVVHELLLRCHARTGDERALHMVEHTLRGMRAGGMYDQLGFGFHRYSTDERWLVPHFEKMLYDQALLVRAYVQAWQRTGREEYATTARETIEYVLRDLTSGEGMFHSAEDADSDLPDGAGHAEGAFYLWTPKQIRALVPEDDARILCATFGVTEDGNFAPFEEGELQGHSVLHCALGRDDLTLQFGRPWEEIERVVRGGMEMMNAARARRPRPHLDDKVLADWNGLMIGALAFAGWALDEPRYVAAAERAAGTLADKLRRPDGRWLHRYRDGEAAIDGFLDDYAYLAEGYLALHQATQRLEHLALAVRTAEWMIEEFADPSGGGFFHTAKSGEKLIARMKESYDGALPAGNSVAALVLLRLGDLCSREDLRAKGESTLAHFAGVYRRAPSGYPYHLCALDALLGPAQEILIVGEAAAPDTRAMVAAVRRRYLPNMVLAVVPPARTAEAARMMPFCADRPQIGGRMTAYYCENSTCRAPVTTAAELEALLDGGAMPSAGHDAGTGK